MIKRFELVNGEGGGYICPDIDGRYVRYEDHVAEVQRIILHRTLVNQAVRPEVEPKFENLQDAPRTLRNVFTVQHEGKRADVVYASFASCIEREANSLRHDMERGMANHNADLSAPSPQKE